MAHPAQLLWRLALLVSLSPFAAASAAQTGDAPPVLPRSAQEAARVATVTAPTDDFSRPEPFEANAGGAGTVRPPDPHRAFLQPLANITAGGDLDFIAGQGVFEKFWAAAPTATRASDGLGPLYNARACLSCHVNNGRGHPPSTPGAVPVSVALHLGVAEPSAPDLAGASVWHATAPDPAYGRQIQPFAVVGLHSEATPRVSWAYETAVLEDGSEVSLRRPVWRLENLRFGPLGGDTMISARAAPPMIGLGLLEAIAAHDILARADPDDADGDGISGRANIALGPDGPLLGRFGWKAATASLRQQTAMAFAQDIGISTPEFPDGWGDCTPAQPACRAAPHGDDDQRVFEADGPTLDATTFYAAHLAVPARRNLADPEVLAGKALFYGLGCIACHTPKFVTARIAEDPARSFQLIWPYTDLLLHDMGPGLADGFVEGRAGGREFRTAPLWGIGLTGAVSGETTFLHDGRARSLTEAILWHGGEALAARMGFSALSEADRAALIRFLESL